jgi:cbb3-type cytochrome oxidase maturation protein
VGLMYLLLPISLALGTAAVLAFMWAVRSGQFDDLTTPKWRAIFDDDPSPSHPRPSEQNQGNGDATLHQ